jgi:hypothetical protein
MDRQFIETFNGPRGKAELYEMVKTFPDRPHVEEVQYEIIFKNESQFRLTIGEASVLACELSGDPRFAEERMDIRTGHSNL